MAINSKTHKGQTVILTLDGHKKIRKIAKINKRSTSSEIAILIEKYIKECEQSGMDLEEK